MKNIRFKTILAIAASIIYSGTCFSASFDCKSATSKVEKMICKSAQLSGLDSQLGSSYRKSLEITKNSKYLIANQRQWLKKHRDDCSDEDCLIANYEDRLQFLSQVESLQKVYSSIKISQEFFGSYGKAPTEFCEKAETKNQKPPCFTRNFASIEPITEDKAVFSFYQIEPGSHNSCDFRGIAIAKTKSTLTIQDLTSNDNSCKIDLSIKNKTLTSKTSEGCQEFCGQGLRLDLNNFKKIR